MMKPEVTVDAPDFASVNASVSEAFEELEPGGRLVLIRTEGAAKVIEAVRQCDGVFFVSEDDAAVTFRAGDPAAAYDWWHDRRRG